MLPIRGSVDCRVGSRAIDCCGAVGGAGSMPLVTTKLPDPGFTVFVGGACGGDVGGAVSGGTPGGGPPPRLPAEHAVGDRDTGGGAAVFGGGAAVFGGGAA
eukprot:gene44870-19863_t